MHAGRKAVVAFLHKREADRLRHEAAEKDERLEGGAVPQWIGRKRRGVKVPADVYQDPKEEARRHKRAKGDNAPLKTRELARFDDALISVRTAAGRRSHIKKVVMVLRREFRQLDPLPDPEVLKRGFTIRGIRKVGAALAAEGLGSGGNYLATWRAALRLMEVSPPEATVKFSLCAGRTLKKFATAQSQASEVALERLTRIKPRTSPRIRRGPIQPDLLLIVATVFMWRGIQLRSQKLRDLAEEGTSVRMTLRTRKSCQSGTTRTVILECLCGKVKACGACYSRIFLRRRLEYGYRDPDDHLAITIHGKPIRREEWTASVRATAKEAGLEKLMRISGHSPRVSGARFWNRVGASRETIAMLGDWKNMAVLERYIGVSQVATRLRKEVGSEQKVWPDGMLEAAMRAAVAVFEEARSKELAKPKLCIVTERKPRRWHQILSETGPSRTWRTVCGDDFNPRTMSLQYACERPEDEPKCRTCGR